MRRRTEDDSLDLLLDTVCNVFGGIIFITMLVAILAFARAGLVPGERGISEDRFRETADQLVAMRRLKTRVHALEAAIQELDDIGEDLNVEDSEIVSDAALSEVTALIEEAQIRLRNGIEQRDRMRSTRRDLDERVQAVTGRSDGLRNEVASLEEQIRRAASRRVAEARLPVRRGTKKSPFHLVLSGGRIFALIGLDVAAKRVDWSAAEQRDVVRKEIATPPHLEYHYELRADGGFPVTDRLAEHPRWKEITRILSSAEAFLSLDVYPDSYDAFLRVKQAALAAGFQYNAVVFGTDEPLVFVLGDEFTIQ